MIVLSLTLQQNFHYPNTFAPVPLQRSEISSYTSGGYRGVAMVSVETPSERAFYINHMSYDIKSKNISISSHI